MNKICPSCRKSDFTDFSTCRYCGKPYATPGNQPRRPVSYGNGGNQISPFVIVIGVLIIGMFFAVPYLNSQGLGGLATTHRYGYSRPSLAAVPIAIGVFASKPLLEGAHDAIAKQSGVLSQDPNNYDALIKRGDAYWTQFNANKALADYSAAISLRPQSAEAYEKRALMYDALSQFDDAKHDRNMAQTFRH